MSKYLILVSIFFLINTGANHSMNRDFFTNLFQNPMIKLNRVLSKNLTEKIEVETYLKLKDDIATVAFNQSAVLDVLANDKLPINRLFKIIHLSNINGGTADIIKGGTQIKITPEFNSSVPVTLTYTVSDGVGAKATAKVSLIIN